MIDRPWWGWILSVLQAGLVCAVFPVWIKMRPWEGLRELSVVLVEASVLSAGVFAVTTIVNFLLLQLHKMIARNNRRATLERLEANVIEILKTDYKRAMRQLIRRAGIRPSDLRSIGTLHTDAFEDRLFSQDELQKFLGLLKSQSIRMTTPWGPAPDFAATSGDRLIGRGLFDGYFVPTQLACLFFTESEVVVGNAVFDSRTGELQTRVSHFPRSSFHGLVTDTKTSRLPMDRDRLLNWLGTHQFLPSEEKAIARALSRHDRQTTSEEPGLPYDLIRESRMVSLSTGRNQELTIPSRMKFALVARSHPAERTKLPEVARRENVSGKRAKYLEYRTRWTLLFNLFVAALLAGGGITLLWHVDGLPTGEFAASSMQEPAMVLENGREKLAIEEQRYLPEALADKVRTDAEWKFACAMRTTNIRSAASSRSKLVGRVEPGHAMAIRISRPENDKLPPGWVEVEALLSEGLITGYLTTPMFEPRSPAGPLVCR